MSSLYTKILLISSPPNYISNSRTSRPLSPMPNFGTPQEEKASFPSAPNSPVKETAPTQDTSVVVEQSTENAHFSTPQAQPLKEDDSISTDSAKEAENSLEEISPPLDDAGGNVRPTLTRETSVDTIASNFSSLCAIKPNEWGAPIRVFHEGNLCLPYISLPYMDLLTDPSVKGYIIGASNVLFQQKRQLADVMVDVENAMIDIYDLDLKRQAQLSTEDLRFTDYIIRHVQNPKEDAEGSEVWIREQFYGYIVALLKSSLCSGTYSSFDVLRIMHIYDFCWFHRYQQRRRAFQRAFHDRAESDPVLSRLAGQK